MNERYTIRRTPGRKLWEIWDHSLKHPLAIATFPSRKAADTWTAEHQEYLPDGFVFRLGHLSLVDGGGENSGSVWARHKRELTFRVIPGGAA